MPHSESDIRLLAKTEAKLADPLSRLSAACMILDLSSASREVEKQTTDVGRRLALERLHVVVRRILCEE